MNILFNDHSLFSGNHQGGSINMRKLGAYIQIQLTAFLCIGNLLIAVDVNGVVTDQDGRSLPGANIIAGYKVEPWMKTNDEDMMVLDMKNVMTMVQCNDIEMITIHQKYVEESSQEGTRSRIDRKMGYISSVTDAKKMLEHLYKKDIQKES